VAGRTGLLRLAALVAAVGLAGGCGDAARESSPGGPRLPRDLAARLASHADAVAAALAAGDCVRGSRLARALQRETIAAINRRRVPQALLEDLQVGVNVLVDDIRCPATTPPTAADAEDGAADAGVPGAGKRHGKGKQRHGKRDEGR
jgi:hypothetical protein